MGGVGSPGQSSSHNPRSQVSLREDTVSCSEIQKPVISNPRETCHLCHSKYFLSLTSLFGLQSISNGVLTFFGSHKN